MDVKSLLASGYRRVFAKPHRPDPAPLIVVMIPLVGKARAQDWQRVCDIREGTLASLRAQSYQNFEVILCSQDRPGNFPDQDGYHFLPAPPHTGAANISDQRVKARLMAEYAARRFDRFSYVMHLDADDLLHPDLFRYVAEDNNGRGYLIEQGYMVDAPSGRIAPMGRAIGGEHDLWEHCGSCAFFAVDWGKQAFPVFYMRMLGKGHMNYAKRSERLGYPLAPVPFPAVLYMVNHGDNMQLRKGHDKLLYLTHLEITDPERIAAIRKDFALSEETTGSA